MHVQIEKATVLAAKAGPQGMEDIDTDDEKDEEAQYELWKGREMARIRSVTAAACWYGNGNQSVLDHHNLE